MRVILAAAVFSLLAGCTSTSSFQSHPVSTGGNPNALKRTPCACVEINQTAGLPEFLAESAKAEA